GVWMRAPAAGGAGGLVHLGAVWRLGRRDDTVRALWPAVVSRFSGLALGSVVGLCAAAVPLAWAYIGSWEGLVGTGYGSLVRTKGGLLRAAPLLPPADRGAGGRPRSGARATQLPPRGPLPLAAAPFSSRRRPSSSSCCSSPPPACRRSRRRATRPTSAPASPRSPASSSRSGQRCTRPRCR